MSQFGAEKFTTRSRAAIEAAQLAATTAGNTATEPIHLLVALLKDADGTAGTLVTKAGVDPQRADRRRPRRSRQPCPGRRARPSSSPARPRR